MPDQPAGDRFSSRPRVRTVVRALGLACCSPNRPPRATGRGSRGIQRVSEFTGVVLGGQGIGVERDERLAGRLRGFAFQLDEPFGGGVRLGERGVAASVRRDRS